MRCLKFCVVSVISIMLVGCIATAKDSGKWGVDLTNGLHVSWAAAKTDATSEAKLELTPLTDTINALKSDED